MGGTDVSSGFLIYARLLTTSITLLHDDKTRAYQSTQRLCLAMEDVVALLSIHDC